MLLEVILDSAALEAVGAEKLDSYAQKYAEPLEVVDDTGTVLGTAPRGLVHRIGLRHSVVYCVVLDSKRERMLLQTRGSGRLDISVGGHVQAGEIGYKEALIREFREEIGMQPDPERIDVVGVYNRDAAIKANRPLERNRERRHLFSYALSPHEEEILGTLFEKRIERHEVLDLRWFTAMEVRAAVAEGRCADGLAGSVEYLI
jgi:8-oxo-dGTP pyrophosphatase MutT (NUDIX family)